MPPVIRPRIGMRRSATNESTMLLNATPMTMPTPRSTTLPLTANSLKSLNIKRSGALEKHDAAEPLLLLLAHLLRREEPQHLPEEHPARQALQPLRLFEGVAGVDG